MTGKEPFGDRIAMKLSRFMGSWWYIGGLGAAIESFVLRMELLNGSPIDVFNLLVSVYTLFVDLVILKAANAFNDTMNKVLNRIIQHEKMSLKYHAHHAEEIECVRAENNTIKELLAESLKQQADMTKEFIGMRAQMGLLIQMMPAKKVRSANGRFK